MQQSELRLTVRQYDRHAGALDHFLEGLVGRFSSVDRNPVDRESLAQLRGAASFRRLASKRPDLVTPLYQCLLDIPRAEKVKSKALEGYARAVGERAAWWHRDEWQRWNELLPDGERLAIPSHPPEIPESPQELDFSEQQLDGLAAFLAEAVCFRFLAKVIWRSRIRPGLGRVARAVGVRR